ncbi:membrane protein [Bifidobacterium cuniculi]|uniref:Membrane protein n=2 Tax=Bifidobacterium cuniculi TaxID=1688 RepID=A0A087AJL8_9BIFI|nr:membrane protein [Bifidobacterium cuniculi]
MLALEKVFLWFLLYSFVGWLWETLLNIAMKKRFVDRGILNGPLCPIYGFGAVIAIFALEGEHSLLAVFLTSGVLACTLEYVTSWGVEKLFHMRLWDYSKKPFNINGRVYLNGFLFFAAGCTVVKFWVQPEVMRVLDSWPPVLVNWLSWILFALLMVDVAVTIAGLVSMRSRLGEVEGDIKAWKQRQIGRMDVHITATDERIERAEAKLGVQPRAAHESVEARVQERLEEATGAVRERGGELAHRVHDRFTGQQRRWVDAFPTMRADVRDPHLLDQVREQLAKYRRHGADA